MGLVTPILIRNDSLNHIKGDKEEFVKKLLNAAQTVSSKTLRAGNFVNAADSLGARHASVTRVLVISENTIIDLTELIYGRPDKSLHKFPRKFIKKCLKTVRQLVKDARGL